MTGLPGGNGDQPAHVMPQPTPISCGMERTALPDGTPIVVLTLFTVTGPVTTFWPVEGIRTLIALAQEVTSGLTIADKLPPHPG